MKKIESKNNIVKILYICLLLTPSVSFAMNIEIGKQIEAIPKEETVILDVYLNSDTKEINAIEGNLEIEGNYEIKKVLTAGSVFDLWPNTPSFSEGRISFVGGSTAGIYGSKLKIFSIAIKAKDSSDIIFSSKDIFVFLNDGAGTKMNVENLNRNIQVSSSDKTDGDALHKIISEDKNPPKEFEIIVGQDDSVFEGKYFASFNTVDNESGLNRYEIIENNNDPIRTGNTYVLQDQSLKGTLLVKAIDNAGNVRISQINTRDAVFEDDGINWLSLSIALMLLLGIFFTLNFLKIKNAK